MRHAYILIITLCFLGKQQLSLSLSLSLSLLSLDVMCYYTLKFIQSIALSSPFFNTAHMS